MNYKILITLVIIILGLISIVSIYFLVQEGNKCISNPFIYGANKIYKQGLDTVCSCQIGAENYIFDRTGLYNQNEKKVYSINFTK